jgi:hypothetical protein
MIGRTSKTTIVRWREDGKLMRATVELAVDWDALTAVVASKAAQNRSHKARAIKGAVIALAHSIRPADEVQS